MKTRFAICIENAEYPASLEIHKIYRVIPDQDAEQDETCGSLMKAEKITSTLAGIFLR
jgi:hypothetical protein